MPHRLFHIIGADEWAAAREAGRYAPDDYVIEGFIHLSEPHQVLGPAHALYSDREDLSLLVIDPDRLRAEVVYEPGSLGEVEHFPHLYGPLNLDAVVEVVPFPRGADGRFSLPAGVAPDEQRP